MNTQFRKNGYYTVSLGKVFHHPEDNAEGWSEPAWRPKGIPWYRRPENHELHEKRQKQGSRKRGPAWESADVPDDAYADGVLAERAIADLRRLKDKGRSRSFWRSASSNRICPSSPRRNTGTCTTTTRFSFLTTTTSPRMRQPNRFTRRANCGPMPESRRRGRCRMRQPAI